MAGYRKSRRFAVAVSFPGEHRRFVKNVVKRLAEVMGKERVFYDAWYEAELAGLDGDLKLKRYYREESELVVPFFSEHYRKPWCEIEWHAIRAMLKDRRKEDAVVPIEMDGTQIEGWEPIDFAIRRKNRTGRQIADLILATYRHRYSETADTTDESGDTESGGVDCGSATERQSVGLRVFFDHLIESHTQLFAGRNNELDQILNFVNTQKTGYIFIDSLSGYGKTSLLAELVRTHPQFVYHFISQGYKGSGSGFDPTQLEILLKNLCQQLHPKPIPAGDTRTLRGLLQRLLRDERRKEPTVVILDAIDEVDRHPNFLLGLFPHRLPAQTVIVLSARTQGDRSYLGEVGLALKDVALKLTLSGLDKTAIAQLLEQSCSDMQAMAQNAEFVATLHRVSAGDPFYLRFLIEDVASGVLNEKNIDRTPSGLHGYLDDQLSQLNRSAHRAQQRDILGLILTAKTALARSDLIHLVPGLDGLNFNDVVRDIHRFLLVHNDRYTFCHSRFNDYFAAKIT